MTVDYRQFGAPRRYIQGPDVIRDLASFVAEHGRRPLVVVDEFVLATLGSVVTGSFEESGTDYEVLTCSGDVTRPNIAEHAALVRDRRRDVVVGIGGGKALDLAKGIAIDLGAEMVTCPTIASNDGPTARILAIYNESHVLCEVGNLEFNPSCVVVDTALIARAPVQFLISGIGDAVAKKFEADACRLGTGNTMQGTRPLDIGSIVTAGCYDMLATHAVDAVKAVENDELTPAVESVVEAVVLLSGIGYENGGLSIAHCMTRGLMAGRGTRSVLHGYHVAYGLLVQLALERHHDDVVGEVTDLLSAVQLPTSLADMGMHDATPDEIRELAVAAMSAPHIRNTIAEVTVETLVAAIETVEARALERAPKEPPRARA
ncbi:MULTISPECIES: glycerol dehydrogenase [Rhodococcus]|uniref:Glycerol dehydrogenase n=1 Tax=Rhodococcoides kyotonense TaxID=398843 RepID=A0A177Y8F9_9NOCA|nr:MULTISPECIES: glycerol dehydrogenase [Rhodococcus]NIL74945.1 Glycerol dehydrogenase [Rhodococcus sp. B10]OAK51773.1 glycerol dehydrogenase [Rhodococcus kyotonensis]